MALSKEQVQFWQTTLEMTRSQISDLNGQIEDELAKVKERLAELQNKKNAAKQIYDGACKILGVENDLELVAGNGAPREQRVHVRVRGQVGGAFDRRDRHADLGLPA